MIRVAKFLRKTLLFCCAGTTCMLSQSHAAELPANIGGQLRHLIVVSEEHPGMNLNTARLALDSKTNTYQLLKGKSNILADAQNRVLVRVVLNGTIPLTQAAATVEKAGGHVVANSTFGRGLISAYIPLTAASSLAQTPGVQALHLINRPFTNVGAVTSQGVVALSVDHVLAQGIQGKHLTVGILSDSFDTSGNQDTAATDVASGDLPNTTKIPNGEGLKALIEEYPNGTDEGRGMAQIVHDMAPGADLCFATAFNSAEGFAQNIFRLASEEGPCNADVIVDDVSYSDEPFFSDGEIGDAVNRVSESVKRNGSRVVYLSSAGNEQYQGYDSFFQPVSLTNAAKQPNSPVDLSTIPDSIDVGGGLHNFGTPGQIVVAQELLVQGNPLMSMQWNDPFFAGKITTSYSLLLFDQNGKFIQASDTASNASSADNAFLTDEPLQAISFDTSATNGSAYYYLVIARSAHGTHDATRIRWVGFGDGVINATYQTENTPVVYGHTAAKDAISVAAYDVNRPPYSAAPPYQPELEDFSSPGPFFNYFDANGNRLSQPEVRLKPDIACVDGVFTTFFGQYVLGTDQYPRFFGTSAAAPCAAGIAALMMDKALTAKQPHYLDKADVLAGMRESVVMHDEDPLFVEGAIQLSGGGVLIVGAAGSNNDIGNPSDFLVSLQNAPGWQLTSLSIRIPARTNLDFFQVLGYYPFTVGAASPGVQVSLLNLIPPAGGTFAQSSSLDLGFQNFKSGDFVEFAADRADPLVGYIDDDADILGNSIFTAVLTNKAGAKVGVSGLLRNQQGPNWTTFDGYGLINADLAVAAVH